MELDHTSCVDFGQQLDALLESIHVDGLVVEGLYIDSLVIEAIINITAIAPKRGDNARRRIAMFRWGVR